jgi:hypothetical protein
MIGSNLTDMISFIKEPVLLYNATKDGFVTNTYYTKCSDKGPTIILIKLNNIILGKYKSQSISNKINYNDSTAFLFDLTSNNKYNVNKNKFLSNDANFKTAISSGNVYEGDEFIFNIERKNN